MPTMQTEKDATGSARAQKNKKNRTWKTIKKNDRSMKNAFCNSRTSILNEVKSLQLRVQLECQENFTSCLLQHTNQNENGSTQSGLTCFEELPLSSRTLKALKLGNFKYLTPIQRECIPPGLMGYDVLGEAETGSGKTLAFLIPVLENLYRQLWEKHDALGALIVTPTRELASQIFDVLREIGRFHTFSAICLIGGKNVNQEKERLSGMNIAIATPGRLLQHLEEAPSFDTSNLKILVVDEADNLLDMGFSETMNHILEQLPPSSVRQTLLFSATLSVAVHRLAVLSLKETAKKISVRSSGIVPPQERLKQYFTILKIHQKLNALFSVLRSRSQKKIIVFVNSCKQVRFICEVFWRLKPGCALFGLHGRQHQQKRLDMLEGFSSKPSSACLLCTDVAARGIDFPSVDVVIQLDCPPDIATYVHRVGRTARYQKCGMTILCLLESETLFLERLKEQQIYPQEMFLRPNKIISLEKKLSSILAENADLKYLAQRYMISYLRSINLSKDKGVFNYSRSIGNENGLQKFASSLGLVSISNDVLHALAIPEKKKKLTKLERFKLKIELKKQKNSEEVDSPRLTKKEKQFQRLRVLRESTTDSEEKQAQAISSEEQLLVPVQASEEPTSKPSVPLSETVIRKRLRPENIRIRSDGTTKIKGLAMLTSKRLEGRKHHVLFEDQEDGTIKRETIFESLVKELSSNQSSNDQGVDRETYLNSIRQSLLNSQETDKERERQRIHRLHKKKERKMDLETKDIHESEDTSFMKNSFKKIKYQDIKQLEEEALNLINPLLCSN